MASARIVLPLIAGIAFVGCGGPEALSYADRMPDGETVMYLKLTVDDNDVDGQFRTADCTDEFEGKVSGKADGDSLDLALHASADVTIPIEGRREGDGLTVTDGEDTVTLDSGQLSDYRALVDELEDVCES